VRRRGERGNAAVGCLALVALLVVVVGLWISSRAGESDCYSTPGSESGSAQWERDIDRCLE